MSAPKAKPRAKKAAKPETALVLRVCESNLTSHNGFKWPESGEVSAPDWKPIAECGNGLHGWLYGAGDYDVCGGRCADPSAKWLVVEVELSTIVMLGGKCKFPRGVVRYCGDKAGAGSYLRAHEPRSLNVPIIGASVEDEACAVVGAYGTATAGYRGTATAGDRGTATAGDRGTATAGDSGTATAGEYGELRLLWWDDKKNRYRTEVAYVGENGIKPNVAYRLDEQHRFVEALA